MSEVRLEERGWRGPLGTAFLLLTLAATVTLLNPRRELLTWDDGWAYARSVALLLKTGHYTLDNWAAANTPVQIALAAFASKIFGYSLTLLRLSTIALLAVLLLSFRHLARTAGSPPGQDVILSLALLASPVLLMLSFTFMSDVQFLAWLILALTLYQRGLKLNRDLPIVGGSIAAACAIGTRQVGAAILGGWLATILLSSRKDRPSARTVALAVTLPIAATAWQLWQGAAAPNFTQSYRLAEQHVFLTRPPHELIREIIWRSAIWIQYSALYLLPLAPLMVAASFKRISSASVEARWRSLVLTLLVMAFVAVGLSLNSPLTVRPHLPSGHWLWPPLGLIWMLPVQPWATPRFERLLDTAGFIAVLPLSLLSIFGIALFQKRRPSPSGILIAGTGAVLFVGSFVYVQLNDTYIATLLPFTLLGVAAAIEGINLKPFWTAATVIWSLAMLFTVTALTSQAYDEQQLAWDNADRAAIHKPFACVAGPKHWAEYHGAFDDWIAAGAPGLRPAPTTLRIGEDPFHDPFYAWMNQRNLGKVACS